MPYVIWMVVLTVIAALLFTAKRNLAEIRDDRQSKIQPGQFAKTGRVFDPWTHGLYHFFRFRPPSAGRPHRCRL